LIPKEKLPRTRRLLSLGSSITFGWGVPAAEVFPEIVRKGLEKAFPKGSFETLNAGVPGYSSFQGMLYLEMIIPRFRPDVVVAEFGINDGTVATGKQDKDWRPRFSDTLRLAL
jgi:lysophospholipase L1-like esterase